MSTNWLVLLPPLIVIALAFITQRVLFALVMGILSGALIASKFSLSFAAQIIFSSLKAQFDPANLYTFGFLIFLGALITLISVTGGTQAYGAIIKKRLTNARNAQTASILLSFCFAIDDFFSILTVGSIMKPVTDSFKVPRIKLAFLIDSLAAPLIILVPVSTWVAMILMQLEKAGVSLNKATQPLIFEDPFAFYLGTIPFVFYSFIIAASVIYLVRAQSSWGLMATHEAVAQKTGNLFGGLDTPHQEKAGHASISRGTLLDFIFPLGTLLLGVFGAILYLGNSSLLGGNNTLAQTMQQTDIFLALLIGSLIALIASCSLALLRGTILFHNLPLLAHGGYDLMKDSIALLFLAWTFGTLLKNDLRTGDYIAHLLVGSVSSSLLPAMFFIASLITSVGTGSSWGTIAVLVPLAVPLVTSFTDLVTPIFISQLPLALPVVGAVFAGAVAGDHVSPIGTTTIMSSASAQADLHAHVKSQLVYAAPALIGTFLAFIVVGCTLHMGTVYAWALSLSVGLSFAIGCLVIADKFATKGRKKARLTP
jgi:Na+/H+ antiporter NhaC